MADIPPLPYGQPNHKMFFLRVAFNREGVKTVFFFGKSLTFGVEVTDSELFPIKQFLVLG